MTWFADGSAYQYSDSPEQGLASVGWLDSKHHYAEGPTPDDFLDHLARYCEQSVNRTRGWHGCEFCRVAGPIEVETLGGRLELGSAELRVPRADGKGGFAAPDLIYHYVADHGYRPPAEFVEAVRSGSSAAGLLREEHA